MIQFILRQCVFKHGSGKLVVICSIAQACSTIYQLYTHPNKSASTTHPWLFDLTFRIAGSPGFRDLSEEKKLSLD